MASTQKKTTASKSGSVKSKSGATAKKGGTTKKTTSKAAAQPQKRPIRREVWAVVCMLLAFFGFIGYFTLEKGAFITLFRSLWKGICGYGFYVAPPALLVCACILGFHRGRPVRLRVGCALALPVILGAVLHILLCQTDYIWSWALIPNLWKAGVAGTAGGAVSGLVAEAFCFAFTRVGAMVVFLVLTMLALLCVFKVSPAAVVDFFREKRENRPQYEEEPEPVKPARAAKPAKAPRREVDHAPAHPVTAAKKPAIDIPVDDSPVAPKEPTTPVTTVRKKKLFDRFASVPSPDQVVTGQTTPAAEPEKPEYEDVPELLNVDDSTFGEKKAEPVAAEEAKPAAPAQPEPVPPPVIREPAVQKVTKEEAQLAHDQVAHEIDRAMSVEPPAYRYPPLSLLRESRASGGETLSELHANQQRLEDTLRSFGVSADIVNVTRGPSVTLYELELEQGVKLNKITNLSDDIALALGASAVRVAPIPDKISTVGIEVPNRAISAVPLREVIGSKTFTDKKTKTAFAVGKNIGGSCIVGDVSGFPHVLIAGTTGSGKSVCTNSLIISLLYKASPEEVRMIMVDPKMVELSVYNGIPHLLIPVVTDPKKAAGALQWAVNEMMKRYRIFSEVGVKDVESYNNHARREGRETMPQIVVIIDELADLMLVAAREVEESICRVAQMGRASGMHLVIATQRPSADVITGLMKANIPSRIAFSVSSALESRIILDSVGAEKLVGKGDMLYSPHGEGKQRVQGCFVTEEEVAAVVNFVKEGGGARYDEAVIHEIEQHSEEKDKGSKGGSSAPAEGNDYDELLPAAIEVVLEMGQASVSMLQRRLKLGYGRAARLVDQMEEVGVVGPFEGSKPRQLVITKEQWQEMQFNRGFVDKAPDAVASEPVPEEYPYEGDAIEQSRDRAPF